MFSVAVFLLQLAIVHGKTSELSNQDLIALVKGWADEIGEELYKLSMNMTRKNMATEGFYPLKDKFHSDDGLILVNDIADKIDRVMEKKEKAVKRIAEYAEFFAERRSTEPLLPDSPFEYYNAENITKTSRDKHRDELLKDEIHEAKCSWWCQYKIYGNNLDSLLIKTDGDDATRECDCEFPPPRIWPQSHYNWLPMEKHHNYPTDVNLNLSVVKIYANIYHRNREILQGIRWSEPLDLVFLKNLEEDDTLKYQYFASPHGFMRHFPALQWSTDGYQMTYDPRTRSWYTEAMTSPKDIIILLDRSGSMRGIRRILSTHIVNNILDTLNDNDYVNIYTFTNSTEPLVPCFNDTLVPANEENLRLLRESLNVYTDIFAADIILGFDEAFRILANFRENGRSSQCNQAIMLITEGIDYDYQPQKFNEYNWKNNTPVRVFTYEIGTLEQDSTIMEWIACANRGYFVNISTPAEVRDKILNYLNVMSRPINFNPTERQTAIWSYLQIDLADRRYTNWLWKKYEGNTQRRIFLDHAKREIFRLQKVFTSPNHMLLKESHDYEDYEDRREFDYMTTVSVPVYGSRPEDIDLIGVAGVDVPIKLLKSLIPHYKIGVNGYAFMLTNNGYVLMHPDHRREFENIPKPTFNRVDLLEVELMDDGAPPRMFNKKIRQLRDNIVQIKPEKQADLMVKFALDDMKRVVLSKRRYYYSPLRAFHIVLALPDKYGLMVIQDVKVSYEYRKFLTDSSNWTVHPEWVYCDNNKFNSPRDSILTCQKAEKLFSLLLMDANATSWFERRTSNKDWHIKYIKQYQVAIVFIATHSGLTRWKYFNNNDATDSYLIEDEDSKKDRFENKHSRAIDEDWYKRTVELNFNKDEDIFVYSVPFEISGYENNTMVTSTTAIFAKSKANKVPVAVVGFQFDLRTMYTLYNDITRKCRVNKKFCNYYCGNHLMSCFILDDNAYIVLSNEIEYTGRFIGDIRPDIMYHLVKNKVYKPTRMYDYQAICLKTPPKPRKDRSSASTIFTLRKLFENLLYITDWALATILMMVRSVVSSEKQYYESIKNDTLAYKHLMIKKTYPTPCDKEMWLFTLEEKFSPGVFFNKSASLFVCNWAYIVHKIPHSNLLFLVINTICKEDTSINHTYYKSPTPVEIRYNESLPCYIHRHGNLTRRIYMNCYKQNPEEDDLIKSNKTYCGHFWE